MSSNQAAVLKEEKGTLAVEPVDMYVPGAHELLVKIESIAINPVEAKLQKWALFPIPYPSILGWSFAGTVTEVGPEVTGFRTGDRIATMRPFDKMGDNRFGAFQKFALASDSSTVKLDAHVSLDDANATTLNLATVVPELSIFAKLSRPSPSGPSPSNGKKVLIYGGSSSLGGLSVNYAAQAGYTVITTSSPANHDFVSTLGAAHIINHKLPHDQVVSELKSNGPYEAVFDTIGLPPVTDLLGEVLAEKGAVYYTITPLMGSEKPLPVNVERVFQSYPNLLEEEEHSEVRDWFYNEYVPKGLANKTIIPTRVEKLPGGLGAVQAALDQVLGVSGKKLVLNPQE